MTPIPIRHIPRPIHKISSPQQRADALRCIRLNTIKLRLFEAYVDEAIGNPETPGLAVWDGPCHQAWHKAFRQHSDAYGAYQAAYGQNPPATIWGVYHD